MTLRKTLLALTALGFAGSLAGGAAAQDKMSSGSMSTGAMASDHMKADDMKMDGMKTDHMAKKKPMKQSQAVVCGKATRCKAR